MRKSLLIVLLVGFVFSVGNADRSQAQLECTDPDLVAVVFDNGDINYDVPGIQTYDIQVWLLNPTAPSGEFKFFEFTLLTPENHFLVGLQLPPQSINIGTAPEYIVGLGNCEPMVAGHFLFATITMIATDTFQGDFYLQPVSSFPSIPGEMAYMDCYEDQPRPMYPISRDHYLPVARINGPDLDYCDDLPPLDMSVGISFEGDWDNLAGTSQGASDGFDYNYDIVDSDTTLTFPHPEWSNPAGSQYKYDVKADYDPTSEMKQWTFVTTAYAPQSDGEMVTVNFDPSFNWPAAFDFLLRDQYSGDIINLNSTLSYSYYAPPGSSQRTFDLMIGSDLGPGSFYVDVDAATQDYSDRDNRAGVQGTASDNYDPLLDIPEPGPPPADYVTASFYQPSWPLGPRFTSDIREVYDPTFQAKTWPLMVETDQSGSVLLSFDPSFSAADNYGLFLKDLQSGQEFNLFPNLTYVFTPDGSGTYFFELTVGVSGPPELNPTYRFIDMGWSLVGFPKVPVPGQNSLEQVILYQAPGYAYMFDYNGASGYELRDGSDPAVYGQGYWIATDMGFTWTMNGTLDLDGIEIPLRDGWTLVGNPLWFPAPFEGIRVRYQGSELPWEDAVNVGWVSMGVLSYDNQTDDYYNAVDLRPWHGYWINGLRSGVSLWFDWPNFQVLPARLSKPEPDHPLPDLAWETELVMIDGDQKQKSIIMGVNPEATVGFDPRFDMPQPPLSPNGGSRLAFHNPEWDLAAGDFFSRDIRPVSSDPLAWKAVITTMIPGEVVLRWDPTTWPEDVDFQIYLPEDNRVVVMSMKNADNLRLEIGNGPVPIVIRTPDMVTAVGDMPGMNFDVGVHPNPFNPTTTIHFDLPRPADAEIRIYSVRGELLGVLGDESYPAGRQEVIWNGRDRSGRNVPSGSYFARLYVDGQAIGTVSKMSLVR